MTANENNRRYLAEAWIDEDTDEEFKKSFLENLLNQLEHHKADGSGFDADMLDGKHYCEISKEIDEKVQGFLRDFNIGNVHFSNDNGSDYTLDFDAIKLYIPTEDGYEEDDMKLPWDENPRITNIPTLMEVFAELYNQVNEKADQEDVDQVFETLYGSEETDSSLVETVEDLQNVIGNVSDENGNINATYINGIQIFIMSESAYAAESEENKNNIKHLYIVKPDDEIAALLDDEGRELYPDGVVTKNPTVAEISRYYEFRVITKTEGGVTKRWLQYRYEGAAPEKEEDETEEEWQIRNEATWNDMAETSDFIDDSKIQEIIMNYLSNGDYSLNPDMIKEAFDKIDDFNKFDTTSSPTQWLLQNFISGAFYKNEPVPINSAVPNEGNSKYLILDSIAEDIEAIFDEKLNSYWDKIYPVGSIYMSMEETSPAELFGGRWEKIQGKFLLASNSTYKVGDAGGEEKHKLTINEIPSHTHAHAHTHSAPGGVPYIVSSDDIKVNLDNYRKWPEKVSSGGYHVVYAQKGSKSGIDSSTKTGAASTSNTGNTGANALHENMPPYLVVNVWRRTS